MRFPCAALVLLLLLAAPAAAELDLHALRASVVQVEVTIQSEDYYTPWQPPNPVGTGGTAFYIGERRLMTNAHVASDSKVVRVKRPDRPGKVAARIVHIAHDSDLAILTVDEKDFFDGMVPLTFADGLPALSSTVNAVGFPMGGRKLSITRGVVSRIELHDYVHPGADRHVTVQVDAPINPGNSGGPVMQGDKVVGVAFQTQFYAQSIGYMIPIPVIRHFLKDLEDGRYDGYPSLGIVTSSLESDALRAYLKVPEGEKGVVILKSLPYSSCDGLVKPNDVLHAIDDHQIENDGTVKIDDDYLELAFVVQEKHSGDTMVLKIRRDGKRMDIPVKLKRWDVKMHPRTEYMLRAEYLVTGGYVFMPLTSNYVARAGWRSDLRYWFNEFYTSIAEDRPGQEQLVVLSRVLRHDSTRYREYSNVVVATVNGERPKNFRHFVTLIEKGDRAVVTFEGLHVPPLILLKDRIAKVQAEILETYNIKEDRYLREAE